MMTESFTGMMPSDGSVADIRRVRRGARDRAVLHSRVGTPPLGLGRVRRVSRLCSDARAWRRVSNDRSTVGIRVLPRVLLQILREPSRVAARGAGYPQCAVAVARLR